MPPLRVQSGEPVQPRSEGLEGTTQTGVTRNLLVKAQRQQGLAGVDQGRGDHSRKQQRQLQVQRRSLRLALRALVRRG